MHYYQYGTARLENNQASKHDETETDRQTQRESWLELENFIFQGL